MKFFKLLIFLGCFQAYSQTIYKSVESVNLQETRELKIQLPRGFDKESDKTYPLILVFDGDYLFEPVAGNVDYYSYWDQMPAMLVVGINQADFRNADTDFDGSTNTPAKTCRDFYAFLEQEVIPYLEENYPLNNFRILVSQGETAHLANFIFVNKPEMFDALINLSPIYKGDIEERLVSTLSATEEYKWYYTATAAYDFSKIREQVAAFQGDLSNAQNPYLFKYFDDFEGKNHYSLVGHAIPSAFESIFFLYAPIGPKEYKNKVLSASSPTEYLIKKYDSIEDLYGIKIKIKSSDVLAISEVIEKTKKWDEYKELSKLARKNFPETLMEDYFIGRYYEENGKPEKAFHYFQNAYGKKQVGFLTRDYIWSLITQLKTDFGY